MTSLNVLAVAGFQIELNDGSPFWSLIDAVLEVPRTSVVERTWDDLEDEDLIGRDVVICYSWGVASVFKALDRLGKRAQVKLLIIMAGVPRGIWQCLKVTFNGGWSIPEGIAEAVCLQVDSIPKSWPIANSGPNRVNILLTGLAGLDHIAIENNPQAHDLVLSMVKAAAEAK